MLCGGEREGDIVELSLSLHCDVRLPSQFKNGVLIYERISAIRGALF